MKKHKLLLLLITLGLLIGCKNQIDSSSAVKLSSKQQNEVLLKDITLLKQAAPNTRTKIAEKITKGIINSKLKKADMSSLVKHLIPFLKDRNDSVRYWTAMSLGHIGKPAEIAVPDLLVALEDMVDSYGSKDSSSGICFALDRIAPNWRERPDLPSNIKKRWGKKK